MVVDNDGHDLTAALAARPVRRVRPGRNRAKALEAVRLVVDRLTADGWRFATLAEAPLDVSQDGHPRLVGLTGFEPATP